MEKSNPQPNILWLFFGGLTLLIITVFVLNTAVPQTGQGAHLFLTYFLNTLPFLILGSLAAAGLNHFIPSQTIITYTPKSLRSGLLTASLLGLALPFGEVGVIPIIWVLYKKGFPPHLALTLLLAAPAVNPITFFATTTPLAPGWAVVQILLSLTIAILTGAVAHRLTTRLTFFSSAHHAPPPPTHPFWSTITTSADTLLTYLPYFTIGCFLAAIWDILTPGALLINRAPPLLAAMPLALLSAHHPLTDGATAATLLTSTTAAATTVYLTLGTMLGLTTLTTLIPVLKFRALALLTLFVTMLTFTIGLFITLFSQMTV